ncbi:hypothetical protein Ancab_011452 [Ancistrocladus abbreviatus]
MAGLSSSFNKFLSFFLLLLHIGCFIFSSSNHNPSTPMRRKHKGFDSRSSLKPLKALSSSWSFIKRIVSSPKTHFRNFNSTHSQTHPSTPFTISSPRSSQHSMVFPSMSPPETLISDPARQTRTGSRSESDILSDNPFSPLRNDIFPCPACGEIFQKPKMLEQHQSIKHAVSELHDGDSGKNIVSIIFKTGWSDNEKMPKIHRILKIHNSTMILSRFEEYRELVKGKAARNGVVRRRDERCIADGNELLRFHCTTFACSLGQNGNSSLCNQLYCSFCGIMRSGFSPKLDGISTSSTSWKAHLAVPDDVEANFAFMNVKRAMLICRVIAGRIGCEQMVADKEDSGFDSFVGGGPGGRSDEDELFVFNPMAVLPCFVIIYSV